MSLRWILKLPEVPEVRHTIYSMDSLGRLWYYLKATQGPHCCMFNFRTAENSSRGRDIWREVPWEIVLQGSRAQPRVASVGTGWAEQSPKSAKKSLAWRPSMATTCDLNSSSSLPNCDATNILTVTNISNQIIPIFNRSIEFVSTALMITSQATPRLIILTFNYSRPGLAFCLSNVTVLRYFFTFGSGSSSCNLFTLAMLE